MDRRREHAVDAARRDGDEPRRDVRHGGRRRAGISGAASYDDVLLRSMQSSYGDSVFDIGDACALPDGEANHLNAVGYGVVHGGEEVVVEARVPLRRSLRRNRPAGLVDSQANEWSAAAGPAAAYAADCGGVGNSPAADGRRRVGPVAVDVSR